MARLIVVVMGLPEVQACGGFKDTLLAECSSADRKHAYKSLGCMQFAFMAHVKCLEEDGVRS
jgi:hypothetical protein